MPATLPVFYGYRGCGTCRKAQQWLAAQAIAVEERAIRDSPPSIAELRRALHEGVAGQRRRLCNSSGGDYRRNDLKTRIDDLSEDAFLTELTENGNLIKRPVLLDTGGALVGFQAAVWAAHFSP